MLGFAPLAALPLAAAPNGLTPLYVNLSTHGLGQPIGLLLSLTRANAGGIVFGGQGSLSGGLFGSARGGLTFGGSANLSVGASLPMVASGGITFSGSATPLINIYRSTQGISIRFNGNPDLRLAGRPIVITALPDSMIVRAEKVSFDFSAVPDNLTLRWH